MMRCQKQIHNYSYVTIARTVDVNEGNDISNLQLVPFDDSQSADKSMKEVPQVSIMISAAFWINLTS